MMTKKALSVFILSFAYLVAAVPPVFAAMSSTNYSLSTSVMDTTGATKSSFNFNLLDSVGQPTPIGISDSQNLQMKAGFIYETQFSLSVEDAASNVIDGLNNILNDPALNLTKQESKSINQAIQFIGGCPGCLCPVSSRR